MSKKMVMAVAMVAVFLASSLMFVIPTGEGDADTTGLPSGYTELEYIQSTGTQYILTGLHPGGTRLAGEVKFSASASTVSSSNYPCLFSCFTSESGSNSDTYNFGIYGGKWRIKLTTTALYGANADTNTHIIHWNTDDGTYLDDNASWIASRITIPSSNNIELPLFTRNLGQIIPEAMFVGCMYYAKFWDGNNILVRDFIPCISPTNAVGMYDLVTSTFYGNAGTGEFIAGPVVANTITIQSSNTSYGTVSPTSVTFPLGSTATVSVSDNVLTVSCPGQSDVVVTATPTAATSQYIYSFGSWSVADGTTITGNTTITATFTRAVNTYTITFALNNNEYGSISPSVLTGVPYGSTVAVNGAVLTIYSQTVTASPVDNAHYLSEFSSWSVEDGAIITGDTTITATFTATVKTYTVTIASNNTSYGTVSASSIANVPYGTTVAVSNNTITINGTTVTATAASEDTEGNTYRFGSWSVQNGATITGNTTITANFIQNTAWNPIATVKRLLWIVPLLIVIVMVLHFAGIFRL